MADQWKVWVIPSDSNQRPIHHDPDQRITEMSARFLPDNMQRLVDLPNLVIDGYDDSQPGWAFWVAYKEDPNVGP